MAIQSMTGFGLVEAKKPTGNYKIEIKSVNNRYLDVQFRMPRALSSFEQKIKKHLSDSLVRGSVYLNIHWDAPESSVQISYDKPLAQKYLSILKQIQSDAGLSGSVSLADIQPFIKEIITHEVAENTEEQLWGDLFPLIEEATLLHLKEREREGLFTIGELTTVLQSIQSNLLEIEELAPARLQRFKKRMHNAVADLQESGVDESRLSFEMTIMAEKLDIAEETTRLTAHIIAMQELFESNGVIGKKMNFLLQEMNRECNTIGSKANDSTIAGVVVLLKEGVEKLREQSLNLV